MRAESVAKSMQMLEGILDGKTYVAIAHESGLGRPAVEQRVKALARDLDSYPGSAACQATPVTAKECTLHASHLPACDS